MPEEEMALNADAGEETSVSVTPTDESQTTEEVVQPAQDVPEESDEKHKGANSRIRELNQRAKEAETKAKTLEEKLAEITGGFQPQEITPQYTPQVEPGAEISPEQYKADVFKTADALVQMRIQQERMLDNITREAAEVVTQFPELNPNSDQFDPEVSESITDATEAYVRANPGKSVKKFVEKLMKPYQKSVAGKVEAQREDLAKQVAQTGVRPTTIKQPEKSAHEKTIEELEKELGVFQS